MNKIKRPDVRTVHEKYCSFEDDSLTPTQLAVLTIIVIAVILIISFSMYGFLNLK